MKDNKGITLIALAITVVLLLIVTLTAVYTSVSSYKLIDLQKYKTQMQAIQSGVDEFYEEFETMYNRNERKLKEISVIDKNDTSKQINLIEDQFDFLKYYIKYRWCLEKGLKYNYTTTGEETVTENTDIVKFVKGAYEHNTVLETNNHLRNCLENTPVNNEWWVNDPNDPNDDVAEAIFDISTYDDEIKSQYYFLTKDQIEELLGVKDINISENFIINFEKRYVFSEDYIEVDDKNDPSNSKKIYCLYQLDEEEKVIEFKVQNTTGYLKLEIIKKTLEYQTVKIRLLGVESTIKEVYITPAPENGELSSEEMLLVEEDKENVKEVSGLGTSEVLVKVKKEGKYTFLAKDLLDGTYSQTTTDIEIRLHEPPILEDNMIPFEKVDNSNKEGMAFYDNGNVDINNWYNYADVLNNSHTSNKGFYATVALGKEIFDNNNNKIEYNEDVYRKVFPMKNGGQDLLVKVWIPKNCFSLINNRVHFKYIREANFINQTGIWVGAKWDDEKDVWVPDPNYNPYTTSLIFNFDGSKISSDNNGKAVDENTSIDQSMNDHRFTGSGVTLNATDKCLTLDGTGGLISKNSFDFGNEFTIEVVYSKKRSGGEFILDARSDDPTAETGKKGIQAVYLDNKYLEVWDANIGAGLADDNCYTGINVIQIAYGTLEHNQSPGIKIRLNNKEIKKQLNWGNISEEYNEELHIGKRYMKNASNSFAPFEGNIYAIRIHRNVLSDNELERNYNSDQKKYFRTYVNNGLQLHYSGTDIGNSDKLWKDISGKGNDGQIVGRYKTNTVPITADGTWNGNSLNTRSDDGRGKNGIISENAITLNDRFTVEISFKTQDALNRFLIDMRNADNDGYQPLYYHAQSNIYYIQFHKTTRDTNWTSGEIPTGESLGDNKFKTVQLTLEPLGSKGGVAKLYINGRKAGSHTDSNMTFPGTNKKYNIHIGKRYSGFEKAGENGGLYDRFYYNGDIYAVRVYNRVLTEHELAVNAAVDRMNFDRPELNATVTSSSKSQLKINLSSPDVVINEYYYKTDSQSTWTKSTGSTLTISATDLINDVKSISVYGVTSSGMKTAERTIRRKEVDITSYNELEGFYSAQLNLTSGATEVVSSLNKNLKNKYINNNYYYASAYAKKASESEGDRIEFYFPPVGEVDKLGSDYLQKKSNQWNKYGVLKKITAGRTNDPLYLRVDYDSNSSKNITNTLYVEKIILINTTKLQKDYQYVDLDNVEWCKNFIDMNDSGIFMYYYE